MKKLTQLTLLALLFATACAPAPTEESSPPVTKEVATTEPSNQELVEKSTSTTFPTTTTIWPTSVPEATTTTEYQLSASDEEDISYMAIGAAMCSEYPYRDPGFGIDWCGADTGFGSDLREVVGSACEMVNLTGGSQEQMAAFLAVSVVDGTLTEDQGLSMASLAGAVTAMQEEVC